MEVILDNYTITISIVIVSFFTAMITSIAGAGGGTILLAYMLQFINPLVAIPIHGTVQLTSNITRAFLFRKYLVWKLILPFCIFLPLGVFVGLIIFKNLDAQKIKFLIGIFIILTMLIQYIKKNNILYDEDNKGCFFQIYTTLINNSFFFEFVQRNQGYEGYGANNAIFRISAQKKLIHGSYS